VRLLTHLFVRNNIDRLFLRSCKNCGCNWCWICREKGAGHPRCPKPLKEVAKTNPRERFQLTSAAVAKFETAQQAYTITEPFIMHRVRARLLQAYFTSIASEMYIPDLVTLPPISLRRLVFANLVQALPKVATVFQDAQALLELVPFASLADALQLPSQEAAKRLKAIHQHLLREPMSVPSSQLVLGSISAQTLVDVVTEYFPFHSKTARSLLSFKGAEEFDGCSITQVLALNLREEWPLFLQAAGIKGECLDRIIQVTWWFFPLAFQRITACDANRRLITLSAQVAASFKMIPIMFCGASHKCRPVEGATLSEKTCDHCERAIVDSAVSCGSCAFWLCSRCSQQPNFSTAELRAQHPALVVAPPSPVDPNQACQIL
jgi:hypothetical protein